jgi:hypothetical protein
MDSEEKLKKVKLKTRKVGSRKLVVRDDETFVGRQGDWLLVKIEGWSNPDWVSLKLFRHVQGPKNLWQVGVSTNRKRFAQTRDARLLQDHHPEIADWVLDVVVQSLARQHHGTTAQEAQNG